MRLILVSVLLTLCFSTLAEAAERILRCTVSLPANREVLLEENLEGGRAKLSFDYTHNLDLRYLIVAEVWGFQKGMPGRKAGYLSIKQEKQKIDSPMNYAINHCERESAKDSCSLGLVAVLSGVGFKVSCDLPSES